VEVAFSFEELEVDLVVSSRMAKISSSSSSSQSSSRLMSLLGLGLEWEVCISPEADPLEGGVECIASEFVEGEDEPLFAPK